MMNKLTNAFVIAASFVVIAVGGVWLSQQYTAYQERERCIRREISGLEDEVFKVYGPYTESQKREHVERMGTCAD